MGRAGHEACLPYVNVERNIIIWPWAGVARFEKGALLEATLGRFCSYNMVAALIY